MLNSTELFPILDDYGNVIGKASRAQCHNGSMLLHPVVHLHIVSPDKTALFLQKRSLEKDIQPGKWDTAVGGHIDFGESTEDALRREAREELGIDISGYDHLLTYVFQSEIEREQVNVFALRAESYDTGVKIDNDEVVDGRFWSFEEIEQNIGANIFTPNFEQEYKRIRPLFDEL